MDEFCRHESNIRNEVDEQGIKTKVEDCNEKEVFLNLAKLWRKILGLMGMKVLGYWLINIYFIKVGFDLIS